MSCPLSRAFANPPRAAWRRYRTGLRRSNTWRLAANHHSQLTFSAPAWPARNGVHPKMPIDAVEQARTVRAQTSWRKRAGCGLPTASAGIACGRRLRGFLRKSSPLPTHGVTRCRHRSRLPGNGGNTGFAPHRCFRHCSARAGLRFESLYRVSRPLQFTSYHRRPCVPPSPIQPIVRPVMGAPRDGSRICAFWSVIPPNRKTGWGSWVMYCRL